MGLDPSPPPLAARCTGRWRSIGCKDACCTAVQHYIPQKRPIFRKRDLRDAITSTLCTVVQDWGSYVVEWRHVCHNACRDSTHLHTHRAQLWRPGGLMWCHQDGCVVILHIYTLIISIHSCVITLRIYTLIVHSGAARIVHSRAQWCSIIGLFSERALQKRLYSAKETCDFVSCLFQSDFFFFTGFVVSVRHATCKWVVSRHMWMSRFTSHVNKLFHIRMRCLIWMRHVT